MQQLEATERKTLFVVDEGNVLFGSLTDGDVRRWILNGGELDGLVAAVCNTNPLVASAASDRDEMRSAMIAKGITCIPVIDESRRITDVLLWENLFGSEASQEVERKSIDLPVVIMAGGFGTRLTPFTSVLPKPLIPINGRTVI